MKQHLRSSAAALLLCVFALPASAQDIDWVAESNEHASVVLELLASFGPEGAGRIGVDGLDEEILDLNPGVYERGLEALREVRAEMLTRLEAAEHPKVRQDLEILRPGV